MPFIAFCIVAFVMEKRAKLVIITAVIAFVVIVVFAWAPWVKDDYVVDKVVEKLGGPDSRFSYLGQDLAVKDIPKEVSWLPFGRYVTFPGEAGWYVSFYGNVS